jgi:hypothetical protein
MKRFYGAAIALSTPNQHPSPASNTILQFFGINLYETVKTLSKWEL